MDLLDFMQRQLARYDMKGDKVRADKLRKIIREWKAMLDQEQQTLSSLLAGGDRPGCDASFTISHPPRDRLKVLPGPL